MGSSLEVIEVTRVTPSDSSESVTLPLTYFDLLWFKIHPVERVIFYKLPEVTRPFFDSVIVPKLKSSLSLSLSHYLPFAGKLVWDSFDQKPTIVYTPNDAVLLTVAETNADFSYLSGNEPFSSTELCPLVPELQVSDESASAMSLQVTLFPTQGFCIGVTAHHGVSDGKTTSMFLKSWAHICKQANNPLPEDLTPSYDRTVINSPPEIETYITNAFNSFAKKFAGGKEPDNLKSLKLFPSPEIDPDVVRFTFKLTREDIQTLRERLKRESSDSKQLRLSTFVITFSYAFTCLIRARGGDPSRPVGYKFAVDCRSLAVAPLNYFGNCVSAVVRIPLTAAAFMGEEGLLAAARFVSDSIEELDENVAWKIPELFKVYSSTPVGSQVLSVAGSTRFGVYGLDFGWGRPERVVIVSIDQGAVSLAESRDGSEGVEIGFSLKKQEMDILIGLLHDKLEN